MTNERPNKIEWKSPEPTAVGAVSSAVAVHVASRRWLSFLRQGVMRTSLFKPRRVPGLAPPKPSKLSWQRTLGLFVIVLVLSLTFVGGIRLLDCTVTYFRIGSFRHLSLSELPSWQPPVCIFSTFAVLALIAWRFRLVYRFVRFIDGDEKDDA